MFAQFDDKIAAKETRKIARDYGIMINKNQDTDREQNRVYMLTDFETGRPLHPRLKQM